MTPLQTLHGQKGLYLSDNFHSGAPADVKQFDIQQTALDTVQLSQAPCHLCWI